jgi:hypothetical protein
LGFVLEADRNYRIQGEMPIFSLANQLLGYSAGVQATATMLNGCTLETIQRATVTLPEQKIGRFQAPFTNLSGRLIDCCSTARDSDQSFVANPSAVLNVRWHNDGALPLRGRGAAGLPSRTMSAMTKMFTKEIL